MAPRMRLSQNMTPPEGVRDYSRVRRMLAHKKPVRKSHVVLFGQLFGLGAVFMLSFGYFSDSEFRQTITNGVAAVWPASSGVTESSNAQHASVAIDPFAQPDSVVPQQAAPVAVKPVIVATPKAESLPSAIAPIAPIAQLEKPKPPPAILKVVVPKPASVAVAPVKQVALPIPVPPLPKPATPVVASKVLTPVTAVKVATPVIAPAAVQVVTKVEKVVVVAQAVPPPVVKIPALSAPVKIQSRIIVPTEKTDERLPPQHTPGEVFSDCENCPKLIVVAATPEEGVFKSLNANYSSDVQSLSPFSIGEHEITFDDWDRCVRDGGCTTQPTDEGWGRGQRPVIHVSFNDINDQYIPWLSRISSHQYRLPSEAEWEFAVRGGASGNPQFAYSFGNDEALLCDYGNSSDLAANPADSNWVGTPCNDSFAATAPVGSLKPNPLGIFDMHGNVWEWVSDCLGSTFSRDPAKKAVDCNFRVLRGGSWASPASALRSAERGWEKPDKNKDSIGFRVVRSLP